MRLRARQDDYANDLAQGPPWACYLSLFTFHLLPLILGFICFLFFWGLDQAGDMYQGPESKCDPDMYWVTESKEMARGTPRDQVSKSNCPGPALCEQGRNAHRAQEGRGARDSAKAGK